MQKVKQTPSFLWVAKLLFVLHSDHDTEKVLNDIQCQQEINNRTLKSTGTYLQIF